MPSWALLTHFHAKGRLWLSIPEPAMPAVHHSLPASGSARRIRASKPTAPDELNAMLSLCVCAVAEEEQRTLLEALQQHIFGSARSSPATANSHHRVSAISAAKRLPCWSRPSIARWPASRRCTSLYCPDAVKPPAVCTARTVARRAERRLVELAAEVTIRQMLLRYLNRLSDCLYAPARSEDHAAHQRRLVTRSRPAIWPPAGRLRPTRQSPGRVALLSRAASAHPSGH